MHRFNLINRSSEEDERSRTPKRDLSCNPTAISVNLKSESSKQIDRDPNKKQNDSSRRENRLFRNVSAYSNTTSSSSIFKRNVSDSSTFLSRESSPSVLKRERSGSQTFLETIKKDRSSSFLNRDPSALLSRESSKENICSKENIQNSIFSTNMSNPASSSNDMSNPTSFCSNPISSSSSSTSKMNTQFLGANGKPTIIFNRRSGSDATSSSTTAAAPTSSSKGTTTASNLFRKDKDRSPGRQFLTGTNLTGSTLMGSTLRGSGSSSKLPMSEKNSITHDKNSITHDKNSTNEKLSYAVPARTDTGLSERSKRLSNASPKSSTPNRENSNFRSSLRGESLRKDPLTGDKKADITIRRQSSVTFNPRVESRDGNSTTETKLDGKIESRFSSRLESKIDGLKHARMDRGDRDQNGGCRNDGTIDEKSHRNGGKPHANDIRSVPMEYETCAEHSDGDIDMARSLRTGSLASSSLFEGQSSKRPTNDESMKDNSSKDSSRESSKMDTGGDTSRESQKDLDSQRPFTRGISPSPKSRKCGTSTMGGSSSSTAMPSSSSTPLPSLSTTSADARKDVEIASLKAKIKVLKNKVQEKDSQKTEHFKSVRAELEGRIEREKKGKQELKEEMRKLREEHDKIQAENQKLGNLKSDFEDRIRKIEAEAAEKTKSEMERIRVETQAETERLKAETERLKAELQNRSDWKAELQTERDRLEERIKKEYQEKWIETERDKARELEMRLEEEIRAEYQKEALAWKEGERKKMEETLQEQQIKLDEEQRKVDDRMEELEKQFLEEKHRLQDDYQKECRAYELEIDEKAQVFVTAREQEIEQQIQKEAEDLIRQRENDLHQQLQQAQQGGKTSQFEQNLLEKQIEGLLERQIQERLEKQIRTEMENAIQTEQLKMQQELQQELQKKEQEIQEKEQQLKAEFDKLEKEVEAKLEKRVAEEMQKRKANSRNFVSSGDRESRMDVDSPAGSLVGRGQSPACQSGGSDGGTSRRSNEMLAGGGQVRSKIAAMNRANNSGGRRLPPQDPQSRKNSSPRKEMAKIMHDSTLNAASFSLGTPLASPGSGHSGGLNDSNMLSANSNLTGALNNSIGALKNDSNLTGGLVNNPTGNPSMNFLQTKNTSSMPAPDKTTLEKTTSDKDVDMDAQTSGGAGDGKGGKPAPPAVPGGGKNGAPSAPSKGPSLNKNGSSKGPSLNKGPSLGKGGDSKGPTSFDKSSGEGVPVPGGEKGARILGDGKGTGKKGGKPPITPFDGVKLRPLFWTNLREITKPNSIWSLIEKNPNQIFPKISTKVLEDCFVNKQTKNLFAHSGDGSLDPFVPDKDGDVGMVDEHGNVQFNHGNNNQQNQQQKTLSILDDKRTQHLCICFKRLPSADDILQKLRGTDVVGLPADQANVLLKEGFISDTERQMLEELHQNKTPNSIWGVPETYFIMLMQVPDGRDILRAWAFIGSFAQRALELKKQAEAFYGGVVCLYNNDFLNLLFAVLLQIGNRMNAGTHRGDAKAFTIDSLSKFGEMKSNTHNKTDKTNGRTLLSFGLELMESVVYTKTIKQWHTSLLKAQKVHIKDFLQDVEDFYRESEEVNAACSKVFARTDMNSNLIGPNGFNGGMLASSSSSSNASSNANNPSQNMGFNNFNILTHPLVRLGPECIEKGRQAENISNRVGIAHKKYLDLLDYYEADPSIGSDDFFQHFITTLDQIVKIAEKGY